MTQLQADSVQSAARSRSSDLDSLCFHPEEAHMEEHNRAQHMLEVLDHSYSSGQLGHDRMVHDGSRLWCLVERIVGTWFAVVDRPSTTRLSVCVAKAIARFRLPCDIATVVDSSSVFSAHANIHQGRMPAEQL